MTAISTHATDGGTAGTDPARSELLDVGAVAGLISCSKRTVYRLADADRMPRPLKVGSLVRWRRTDIFDWIANGCRDLRAAQRGKGAGR